MIEFSGNVAQVRDAFHTEIHRFLLNGEEHTANTTDPQIPAALAPVVAGIVSLHNFRKQPQIKSFDQRIAVKLSPESEPQVTFPNGLHALGPGDYAVIYNMNPILQGPPGISGPPAGFGTAIAIVGRSNININDVSRFWGIFNVRSDSPQVFLDGPDPGNLGGGEEAEAVLDTSWSGALAPGAAIKLVVSASTEVTDGADLSELYIVDNDVGQIMSESFSGCEAMATSAQVTAVSKLAEQAAAEGITYIVGSGDTGSAGCDHLSETTATGPLSVNLLASTPFTVAVGGTQFNENGNDSLYWSSTNNQSLVSVLRYIPENVWNESCAAAQCGQSKANIAAGGGGASMYFSKPRWQSGIPGIPNDGMRDVPDVALAAAGGHDPYLLCLDNSCLPDAQGRFSFVAVGGTSAAAPAFAAIMALVNSAVVPLNNPARLGQVNNVLYALAAHESLSNCNGSNTSSSPASNCVFNDVTVGNNAVPGEAGYGTATAKYQSGSGYDLASGLGSVNVTNLVNNWTKTFSQTTTTLSLNPTTFTHGTPVQVNISVTSQNGTPTGDVSLYTSSSIGLPVPGNSFTLNSSGSVLATTKMLPGGGGSLIAVTAHYAGDGTFGWSDSTPVVLTVTPENSSTFLHIMTPGPSSGAIYTANTVAYGSPYILRADVTNTSDGFPANGVPICGTGCPTGKVVITANGQPLDAGMFSLNSLGYTEDQSIQLASSATPYAPHAAYQGDFNFNGSVSDLSVTITQAQTGAAVGAQPSTGVTTAMLVTLTATVTTQSNSTSGPSGTVTFFNNGTPIGNPVTVASLSATKVAPASATASLQTTFPAGSQSITAMYNGDVNYAPSPTSNPLSISVSQAPPGFIAAAAGVIIIAGGLGSSTVTVTPTGGFAGQVAVSCPAASLPPGVTCNPLNITVSGSGSATGQLTVNVAAPSAGGASAEIRPATKIEYAIIHGSPPSGSNWWKLSATTGLAAMFLFLLPGRRRYCSTLALWVVCMASFALGCGGGAGGAGIERMATTTKITAPQQTKVASGTSLSFNIAVTSPGATPGGMVQLFDGTAALGSGLALTNGAASISTSLLTVGTHQISAKYLGDSGTLPSQSGAVSVTVTGTTTVGITTSPASSNSNVTFGLTIN
jgi:hypothetical protein